MHKQKAASSKPERARAPLSAYLQVAAAAVAAIAVIGIVSGAVLLHKSAAAVATTWRLPFEPWNIDPEFDFGTPYGGELHLGEDVERPAGTAVTSIAAGVVKATLNSGGYHQWGGIALIEHTDLDGKQYVSLYGHLNPNTFSVRPGEVVTVGQRIGYLGDYAVNGNWNEHLHLAIRKGPYTGSWVWYGFGSNAALSGWEKPSTFVAARANRVTVGRVPAASRDRYETAVGVSAWRFPTDGSATEVLLASGETWVGALAASPLTLERSAPLLLTRTKGLPDSTLKELRRVLPAGGTVTIIGDSGLVPQPVVNSVASYGYNVRRITGGNPAQLSVAAAATLPTPTSAFLVSDANFADAVSAGTAAAATRTPVLMTNPQTLSPDISGYLQGYGIKQVTIVGGNAAVSASIDAELATLGITVQRVAGSDRYDTSQRMASQFSPSPAVAILAAGGNFPDSLVGASLAAQLNGALLLTERNSLPGSIANHVLTLEGTVGLGLVLGGSAAIGSGPEVTLAKLLNGL